MSWGGKELKLFIDNEYGFFKQKEAIRANLAKFVCKGNFSIQKAKKGFSHVTDPAARQYAKEHGGKFSLAERKEAQRDLTAEFVRDVRNYRNHGMQDVSTEMVKNLTSCKTGRKR